MLFPISDEKLPDQGPAYVTWSLFAANLVVFAIQMKNPAVTLGWSMIPYEIVHGVDLVSDGHAQGPDPIYLTLLSSMFMHGGLFHLAGNLLYLWIFADNLENVFGRGPFLLFYLGCGLAASLIQIGLGPEVTVPNLGASGAIAGVLGGYLVYFPHSRVRVMFFLYFIFRVFSVPAIVVIGIWIAFQLIAGFGSLAYLDSSAGGIAYGAHIGGFAVGALVALVLQRLIR
ncbi:rhomboid family intramembrane serine protease [Bacteroidota bacterium]